MAELELSPEECTQLDRLAGLADRNDYYALLGVGRRASPQEIQGAYYDLSRAWHPDRFFRKEVGAYRAKIESVFVAITEAYRILSSEAERSTYDLDSRKYAGRSNPSEPEGRPAPTGGRRTSLGTDPFAEAKRRAESRRRPGSSVGSRRKKAMDDVRGQVVRRLKKARRYYLDGKSDYENGDVLKAVSSLALATTYDPKNEEYRLLSEQVHREARKLQSKQFIAAAESAEGFANWREAQANYEKAVEYETEDGRAYYRLAMLVRRNDDDRRTALKYMRQAIVLEPDVIEYRMGIADLFTDLGLKINARAQYEKILKSDKNHAEARAKLKALR
ncbi:MAG: DnaJ domain-containing protein [Myxococcota bacterium]|nr:DnaJ domain-containing protein [Myxococcota bacterium]